MKHEIGEIWKEKEGSKIIWQVQFPKGIASYNKKKVAMMWAEQLMKDKQAGII